MNGKPQAEHFDNIFEVGDIVCLKSGGPKMTVFAPRDKGGDYKCIWFTRIEDARYNFFPEECLELATDPPISDSGQ